MNDKKQKIIVHVCTMLDWGRSRQLGEYRADSLESQGFIHCSDLHTVLRVANFNWKGRQDLILLVIDSSKVKSEIKFEPDPQSGILYPHIYGPLNLNAVIKVKSFLPNKDGIFDESSLYME